MSRDEAVAVLEDCMKVLYYRDARSMNKVSRRSCAVSVSVSPFSRSAVANALYLPQPSIVPNRNHHSPRRRYLRFQIE